MHRRTFLRLLTVSAIGATLRVPFAWATVAAGARVVSAGGRLYRSDGSGRVYVSLDAGKTWGLHSDLGSSCAITKLTVDSRDRLHANVAFSRWSFGLLLGPDLRSWLTT
jgi:hypothetical protein